MTDFLSDRDRYSFLKTLCEVCQRTGWRVHAYILMTNHYHLLVETLDANLVAGMRWFQSTYTSRFNGRNKLVGHLFQGRYKALIIDPKEVEYFLTVSEYIHLNPARAGLLDAKHPRLFRYHFSSYPYYIKSRGKRPSWLHVEKVFRGLKIMKDNHAGRKKYSQYMNLRVREVLNPKTKAQFEKEWMDIRRGWYLGNDTFKEMLLKLTKQVMAGKKRSSFSGESKRMHDERAAEELLQKVFKLLKINDAALDQMMKSDPKKQAAAWLLKTGTSVSNSWIAERLSMGHQSAVNNAVRALTKPNQKYIKSLQRKMKNILRLGD